MHRVIQDHLEEVLAEPTSCGPLSGELKKASAHLAECEECREAISAMRLQASALRALRASDETLAPRPGFYARVMERIEAQRPIDIWQLFFESALGRGIAVASMALAFLFTVYLVSSERLAPQPVAITVEENQPEMRLTQAGLPDKDTVLVDLVTYREQ
jgi:predicted anti-sigma-YlaC factor YlaD